MCYFIIGNLHRLKAELKDRGLIHHTSSSSSSTTTTTSVTVATVVRALQVAASCPYPPASLSRLVAKAVRLNRSKALKQSSQELKIRISNLEAQAADPSSSSSSGPSAHSRSGSASSALEALKSAQAQVRAAEVSLRRADAGDGLEVWDVPVDVLLLENQLDDYLMSI